MAANHGGSFSRRSTPSSAKMSSLGRKKSATTQSGDSPSYRKSFSSPRSMVVPGERTVKKLRLSRALTLPQTTSIKDACRTLAASRADALLLTDSSALLCGILTDKDIHSRVIACEVNIEKAPVSQVMTRNPVFVLSDTPAVDALRKMVQGKFRHLPVVENGEVIALLDITKCLYDAISRLERAAEKGKAISTAVESVEKQWGTLISGHNTFVEMLRERMFKPTLITLPQDNSKVVQVKGSDTVLAAAKRILEFGASSAVVTVENKLCGILTSKDMLMKVIAQNLQPESCLVEKVMTPNPEYATPDTPIVDALRTMYEGRFLHLPVVDKDGVVSMVIDVLHITHAALQTVGSVVDSETANAAMMQKFWDSAMSITPEEEEIHSQNSFKMPSDGTDNVHSSPQLSSLPNTTFTFKFQDRKGNMHRCLCEDMADLMTSILNRVGDEIDRNIPQILYEDEDKDIVVIASNADLQAAIWHAKLAGWKGLRLHLDYSRTHTGRVDHGPLMESRVLSGYTVVATGAAIMVSVAAIYLVLSRRAGR